MKGKRGEIVLPEIELPDDLPELYRELVGDLAATLSEGSVAGRAADELHELVDRIVGDWDEGAKGHRLTIEGNLLEMLRKPASSLLDAVSGAICAEVGCGSSIWPSQNRKPFLISNAGKNRSVSRLDPPAENSVWRKVHGVQMANGEWVAVVHPSHPPAHEELSMFDMPPFGVPAVVHYRGCVCGGGRWVAIYRVVCLLMRMGMYVQ